MSNRSRISSRANKKGRAGEKIANSALERIGCLMVEEIGTPFKIIGRKVFNGQTWLQGFWKSKVSGDRRCVRQDGISVLVETKMITDRSLRWSDFKEHQPDRLDQHAQYAISLVVWVRDVYEVFILQWPIPGFGPGQGITPERAQELTIDDVNQCKSPKLGW